MLVSMWNNQNSQTRLVGVYVGTSTLEMYLLVFSKDEHMRTLMVNFGKGGMTHGILRLSNQPGKNPGQVKVSRLN